MTETYFCFLYIMLFYMRSFLCVCVERRAADAGRLCKHWIKVYEEVCVALLYMSYTCYVCCPDNSCYSIVR